MRLHSATSYATRWFKTGRSDGADTHGPRGSPFQWPTRLADGLDALGGLGNGSHCRSPHPVFHSGLWFPPRRLAGRRADLGCLQTDSFHIHRRSQARLDTVPRNWPADRAIARGSPAPETSTDLLWNGQSTANPFGFFWETMNLYNRSSSRNFYPLFFLLKFPFGCPGSSRTKVLAAPSAGRSHGFIPCLRARGIGAPVSRTTHQRIQIQARLLAHPSRRTTGLTNLSRPVLATSPVFPNC